MNKEKLAGRSFVLSRIKKIICLWIMLPFWSCDGYPYLARVMRMALDKEKNIYQLVLGIGDYHDKDHPANKEQRSVLEALIKKTTTNKTKVIVEDLSSLNNDGRMMCCNYSINSQGGMLGRLADTARSLQKNVDNVEYRYCRVASVGPLLCNIKSQPHLFKSSASIMIHSLYKEVFDEINRIKAYNDGKVLNTVYKHTVNNVNTALARLSLNPHKNISVADYCSHVSQKQYAKELENLCIFDSALIDMKMVHSIVNARDTSLIIAVAGGSHIEQVCSLLERVGYDTLFSIPNHSSTRHSLENLLSSDNKKISPGLQPQSIDLKIIERFIE